MKRSSWTGGCAKGIPWKSCAWLLQREPWTDPAETCATGAPSNVAAAVATRQMNEAIAFIIASPESVSSGF